MSDDTVETTEPRRTRLLRVAEHIRTQNWTAISIEFTERPRDDLRGELWVYDFLVAYYRDVRDAGDRAIGDLEGAAPLSSHDLLVAAYRASQYREGARRRDTYDELVSTGSLGLVTDQLLLQRAASIYRLRTIEPAHD
jgi:hypothetical protein